MALSPEQRTRYERNILIPGLGVEGQERLARSSVAVIGLGGLGSPVAFYLAAAGVGRLGLFDSDSVELSNLQRQVLHTTARIGLEKTASAVETLRPLNPGVVLLSHQIRLTAENAPHYLADYDAVVEATDNFESKFMLNDACLALRKPFATAGILALSGHALFVVPGQSPCVRCAVPEIPRDVPTTAELGVLGAVPGILGSVQAMEIIRWAVGLWKPLPDGCGRLHSVDGQSMRMNTLLLPRRIGCRCEPLWQQS